MKPIAHYVTKRFQKVPIKFNGHWLYTLRNTIWGEPVSVQYDWPINAAGVGVAPSVDVLELIGGSNLFTTPMINFYNPDVVGIVDVPYCQCSLSQAILKTADMNASANGLSLFLSRGMRTYFYRGFVRSNFKISYEGYYELPPRSWPVIKGTYEGYITWVNPDPNTNRINTAIPGPTLTAHYGEMKRHASESDPWESFNTPPEFLVTSPNTATNTGASASTTLSYFRFRLFDRALFEIAPQTAIAGSFYAQCSVVEKSRTVESDGVMIVYDAPTIIPADQSGLSITNVRNVIGEASFEWSLKLGADLTFYGSGAGPTFSKTLRIPTQVDPYNPEYHVDYEDDDNHLEMNIITDPDEYVWAGQLGG